jgi:hypothetical protein
MRFVMAAFSGFIIGFVLLAVPQQFSAAAVGAVVTTVVLFSESALMQKLEDIEKRLGK